MRVRIRDAAATMSPQRIIVAAFAATIIIGTLLLSMPVSNADGLWHFKVDTLFLATSGVCVTGLDPVGIGTALSDFGVCILLLLVQLGGIGVMTIGTFFFISMGKSLSVSEERAVTASLGDTSAGSVVPMIWKTLIFTVSWETIGAIYLARIFALEYGYSALRAIGHGVFYSVMAFCNAGFGLCSDSLVSFADNSPFMLGVAALIIVGGIGFIVHANIVSLRPWKRLRFKRGRITLHTKIVLSVTAALILLCTGMFLALEWNGAFASMGLRDKFVGAFFQAVTPRTAGFAGTPTESLSSASQIVTMAEMFVGASPGSTAGGIKITTLAVLIATVWSMLRNRSETELFGRTVRKHTVRESVAITAMGIGAVFVVVFLLSVTEPDTGPGSMMRLAFESVSAFATCGLSAGATHTLTATGKLLISILMFAGRLGPITLVMTMSRAAARSQKRYPEENIIVG